jgi:hypothetical protein
VGPPLGPPEGTRLRDGLGAVSRAAGAALQGLWWSPSLGSVLHIGLQDSVVALGDGPSGPALPLAQIHWRPAAVSDHRDGGEGR